MGGAFVAVADDARATWWNPAGLPNSLIVDGVVDFRRTGSPTRSRRRFLKECRRAQWQFRRCAFAFPASASATTACGSRASNRLQRRRLRTDKIPGPAPLARSLLSQQFGVSLAQSLGDAVVVGGTVRFVRGSVATVPASVDRPGAALDAAGDASGPESTHGDVDLGALLRAVARAGRRGGAQPGGARRYRADGRPGVAGGPASVSVWRSSAMRTGAGRQVWTVACRRGSDARTDADWRSARTSPSGVERWIHSRRVGLRGGVHVEHGGRRAAGGGRRRQRAVDVAASGSRARAVAAARIAHPRLGPVGPRDVLNGSETEARVTCPSASANCFSKRSASPLSSSRKCWPTRRPTGASSA